MEQLNVTKPPPPVGGFSSVAVIGSPADYCEAFETTEDVAKNERASITILFGTFTPFSSRSLHLTGELYAVGWSLPNDLPVAV